MGLALIPAAVIGALLALGVRYLVRDRQQYGLLVLPALGAAVTCVVWVIGVWAGLVADQIWIWLISLGAATAASVVVARVLPARRSKTDDALLERLMDAKV
jgi:hypothetical protein